MTKPCSLFDKTEKKNSFFVVVVFLNRKTIHVPCSKSSNEQEVCIFQCLFGTRFQVSK